MKTLIMYGASDDLIEFEGIPGADGFPAYSDSDLKDSFIVGGVLKIYAIYDGCWHFSIGPVDEDILLPEWPIRYKMHENGYSVQIEIDVPDNTALFRVK